MEIGTYFSLGVYFIVMLGIGFYAYRTNEESASGYLLGGRKLSAPVTALSAGASDMSGCPDSEYLPSKQTTPSPYPIFLKIAFSILATVCVLSPP